MIKQFKVQGSKFKVCSLLALSFLFIVLCAQVYAADVYTYTVSKLMSETQMYQVSLQFLTGEVGYSEFLARVAEYDRMKRAQDMAIKLMKQGMDEQRLVSWQDLFQRAQQDTGIYFDITYGGK